jgi:hypothetical protein
VTAFLLGSRTGTAQLGMTMAFVTLSLLQLFAALGFHRAQNPLSYRVKEHPMLWQGLGARPLWQHGVSSFPLCAACLAWPDSAAAWLESFACILKLLFTEWQKILARRRREW